MKIPDLHPWKVTPAEAFRIQDELRRKLILRPPKKAIRTLAAGDVAYDPGSETTFAAILLFSYPEMEVLAKESAKGIAAFPYIPTLLTFREAPLLLKALSRLPAKPDLLLVDGQGIAHPRSMGIAAHLGVILNLPTIGCAKSRLIGIFDEPGAEKGNVAPLFNLGKRIGTVVRTRTGVKPVFVSPGNRMDMDTSVAIVLSLCRGYRLPEPQRQAHIYVNQLRQNA
jgi:deoxyribonuclease V